MWDPWRDTPGFQKTNWASAQTIPTKETIMADEKRKRKTGAAAAKAKVQPAVEEQTLLTAEPPPIPETTTVEEEKVEAEMKSEPEPTAATPATGIRKIDPRLLGRAAGTKKPPAVETKVEAKPAPVAPVAKRPEPKPDPKAKVELSPSFEAAIEAAKIEERKETVETKVDPTPRRPEMKIETDVLPPRRTRTPLEIEASIRPPAPAAARTKVEPESVETTVKTEPEPLAKKIEPTPAPVKTPEVKTETPRRPPTPPTPPISEEWGIIGKLPSHIVYPVTGGTAVREIEPDPTPSLREMEEELAASMSDATQELAELRKDIAAQRRAKEAAAATEVVDKDGDGAPPHKEDRRAASSCKNWCCWILALLLAAILAAILLKDFGSQKIVTSAITPVVKVEKATTVPAPAPVTLNPCGEWGNRAAFVRHYADELRRPGNPLEGFSEEVARQGAERAANYNGCLE